MQAGTAKNSSSRSGYAVRALRTVLTPVSWLYGIVMRMRNYAYDNNWLPSYTPPVKSVCVGNLSVGGTGKTPVTNWLAQYLGGSHKVAVLSRGYGRKTHGYITVSANSTATEVGDEPLMTKLKNPDIFVAVCEDRVAGVKKIMQLQPDTEVIIFDDAMQHRRVKCGLTVLVTPYDNLYTEDMMLPTGNLREPASGAKRADITIVSKCPENADKQAVARKLGTDNIIFSSIDYGTLYRLTDKAELPTGKLADCHVILTCAIGNPAPLGQYLNDKVKSLECIFFPDHYQFTEKDLLNLQTRLSAGGTQSIIITTEKDAVRFSALPLTADLENHIYIIPICPVFDNEALLTSKIKNYVTKN